MGGQALKQGFLVSLNFSEWAIEKSAVELIRRYAGNRDGKAERLNFNTITNSPLNLKFMIIHFRKFISLLEKVFIFKLFFPLPLMVI